MRRKFRNFGIFTPKSCDGSLLSDLRQERIAKELIAGGFRETRWQYIYQNQVYGLVLPYENGRNEVHVRFYKDRIFAEYEIGRSSLAHFLGPFLNANSFIIDTLDRTLGENDLEYLQEMTAEARLTLEELRLDKWLHRNEGRIISHSKSRSLFSLDDPAWVSKLLSWKFVVSAPLAAASVLSASASLWVVAALLIGSIMVFNQTLPQIGRP